MKILVPFDFSKESINALKLAKDLAQELNLDIKVFHSLGCPKFPYNQTEEEERHKNNLLNKAEQETEKVLRQIFTDIDKIDIEVSDVSPSAGIIKCTYDRDVLYTIVGSKKQVIPDKVGSTTRNIVRHAQGAIISVTDRLTLNSIKNILLVTDFTNTPVNTIHSIKLIQKITNAKITLLYVNTKQEWASTDETNKQKEDFCKIHGLINTELEIINDENLEKGIFNMTKSAQFDLLGIRIKLLEGKLDLVNTHLSVERIMDNIAIPVLSYTHRRPFV